MIFCTLHMYAFFLLETTRATSVPVHLPLVCASMIICKSVPRVEPRTPILSFCALAVRARAAMSYRYCMPSKSMHLIPAYARHTAVRSVGARAVTARTRPPDVAHSCFRITDGRVPAWNTRHPAHPRISKTVYFLPLRAALRAASDAATTAAAPPHHWISIPSRVPTAHASTISKDLCGAAGEEPVSGSPNRS